MQAHQASQWDDTLSILQTELKGSLTREDVELGPRNLSTEWDRILGLKACAKAISHDPGGRLKLVESVNFPIKCGKMREKRQ
jgi:hypothetical protein